MTTSNQTGLKAVGKAILCKPYMPEITASVIEIPDHVRTMQLYGEMRATVIQIGAWCWKDEPEARAKPGDNVLIQKYCGAVVKSPLDGQFYRFCNDQDIFALIEGDMSGVVPENPIVKEKQAQLETARRAQGR